MKVAKTPIELDGRQGHVIALGNVNPGRSGLRVTLDEKLWLTEDKSEAVADGDERAAFLLGCEGDTIPIEQAQELGLSVDDSDMPVLSKKKRSRKKPATGEGSSDATPNGEGDNGNDDDDDTDDDDDETKSATPGKNKMAKPAADK